MTQRKNEYVPYAETRHLIEGVQEPEIRGFISLMYGTGCRVGELSYGFKHTYKIFKHKKKGPNTYQRTFIREEKEVTYGLKKKNISHDDRAIYLFLPNFKYKNMKNKRAYISKIAEPWLTKIIMDFLESFGYEEFIFKHRKNYYQKKLFMVWPYTSHSLRVSRTHHLYYDMKVGVREIADQLGHADLKHITSYLKSRPEEYLDQMEKAKLPEVVK